MLSHVIRLVVITALVYAGVQLWYGGVEKHLQEEVPSAEVEQQVPLTTADEEPAAAIAADDDVQAILDRNIFLATRTGEAAADNETAESNMEHLTQTQLSLSLLGTVTGDQDDARAIIRDDTTKLEDLYQVGSEIQGARINRITRGKVVLLVHGREEVLSILDRDGEGGGLARKGVKQLPAAMDAPDEGVGQQTPKALPRRRISFRSAAPGPPLVAPPETEVAPAGENFQSDAAQEVVTQPEAEADLPGQEVEPDADEPEQEKIQGNQPD